MLSLNDKSSPRGHHHGASKSHPIMKCEIQKLAFLSPSSNCLLVNKFPQGFLQNNCRQICHLCRVCKVHELNRIKDTLVVMSTHYHHLSIGHLKKVDLTVISKRHLHHTMSIASLVQCWALTPSPLPRILAQNLDTFQAVFKEQWKRAPTCVTPVAT